MTAEKQKTGAGAAFMTVPTPVSAVISYIEGYFAPKSMKKTSLVLVDKRGFFRGGPDRIRTDDPHNANVVRSQLRYKPRIIYIISLSA